jgi:hypothetical protein
MQSVESSKTGFSRFKNSEFLSNLFVRKVEGKTVRYGRTLQDQQEFPIATAGATVSTLFNLMPGSELRAMSFDFPDQEYGLDSQWYKWLIEACEKKVKIKIIGGPEVRAKEGIKNLIQKGAEIRVPKNAQTRHVLALCPPNQLWIESYHAGGGNARDCTFTDNPDPLVWKKANEFFNGLWNASTPLRL